MMTAKALLFGDTSAADRIHAAPHSRAAKALGREVRGFDEQHWAERRFELTLGSQLHSRGRARADEASPGLAMNRDLDLADGREVEPAAVGADAGHVRAARVAGRVLNGGAVERGAGPRGQGECWTTVRLASATPVTTSTMLSV